MRRQLPLRMMAYTPCYRREAGSAGRDTRGMLRAHEFDKVEILAVATPEQAPDLLVEMTGRAEALIAGLGLPYRIIEICTGDMGQSHHRSFDIEVYAPGADAWLEVVVDLVVQRLPGRAVPTSAIGSPARRARRSPTRSTGRRSPSRGCGPRSSRTTATPTAAWWCPMCCVRTCAASSGSPAMSDLASRRADYESAGLDVGDVDADPIDAVAAVVRPGVGGGLCRAERVRAVDRRRRGLAAVSLPAGPRRRQRGFSFFTNYESAKSAQLTAEPRAAMLFTWLQLHRQVRVVGVVERLPEAESDAYYASRPRSSQIGAWSSPQSQVLPDRASLEERVAQFEADLRQRRAGAAPRVLGWLAAAPGVVRVLAGPAQPPARSRPLSPGWRRLWVIERLAP